MRNYSYIFGCASEKIILHFKTLNTQLMSNVNIIRANNLISEQCTLSSCPILLYTIIPTG